MARSPAEIQADIALTRRLIETRLEALHRRLPHAWWTPWLVLGSAFGAGMLLSQVPAVRVLGIGAKTIRTGLQVVAALAAVERFIAERRGAVPARMERAA